MAKKAKQKAKSAATKKKPVAAKKPAAKAAAKKPPPKKPAPAATDGGEPVAAAPKALKPLTMKQRLALIRIDPTTGKCPHGLMPETCSFCMDI